MNYCELKNCDIANGNGVRVTLFVSGCTNHCEGCFQPETWNFDYGSPFTEETKAEIIKMLAPDYINGLTLLGGDPFEPKNQRGLVDFLREVKEKYPQKDIWAYTGFKYEAILTEGAYPHTEVSEQMLGYIDVLVDGPFVLALKDISLRFKGSANQRLIDMNKTRERGEIVIWND